MFRNSVTVNLANFLRKMENPECTTQDAEPRRILSGAVMWFWTVNSQLICETLYMAPQQITPGEKKKLPVQSVSQQSFSCSIQCTNSTDDPFMGPLYKATVLM